MEIVLYYFTGTGNSLKAARTCQEVFTQNNHVVTIEMIQVGTPLKPAEIIGFFFPVYAFGIPRICRKFLHQLKKFEKQKVFVLVTAGDADEAGFSIDEAVKIMKKKNGSVIYSGVIQMPINWTTSPKPPFPPGKEEANAILETALEVTRKMAMEITNGLSKYHRFNFPKRYSRLKFYSDYFLFKYLGIMNLWRNFRVYPECTGCGICAQVCPTASITISDKNPVWASSCEQCMRCVNTCPHEAIYQTMGGDTRGKHKYLEPDFKPLKEKMAK